MISSVMIFRKTYILLFSVIFFTGSFVIFPSCHQSSSLSMMMLVHGANYNPEAYSRDLRNAREQADRVLLAQKRDVDRASSQLQTNVAVSARVAAEAARGIDENFRALNEARKDMIQSKEKAEKLAKREQVHRDKLGALTSATNAERERLDHIVGEKNEHIHKFKKAQEKYYEAGRAIAVNRQNEITAKDQFEQTKKNLAQLSELQHNIESARKQIGSQVNQQLIEVQQRADKLRAPRPQQIPIPVAPVLTPPPPRVPSIIPQTPSPQSPVITHLPAIPSASFGPTNCGCGNIVPSHVYGPGSNSVPGAMPNANLQNGGYPCGHGSPLPSTPGTRLPCGSTSHGMGQGILGSNSGIPGNGPNPYCPGHQVSTCKGCPSRQVRHSPEFDAVGRILNGPGRCDAVPELMNQILETKHCACSAA